MKLSEVSRVARNQRLEDWHPIYLVSSNWHVISRSNDDQYHQWLWGNCIQGLVYNGCVPVAGLFNYGTLVRFDQDGEVLAHYTGPYAPYGESSKGDPQ